MSLPERIPLIDWAWDDLLFLVLAGILIGAALLVVLGRDIIRSGLWMILAFAALAGVYVLLGAPLVAAAQVLVYIGAISVLVLFAIMLTQSKAGPSRLVFHHQAGIAGVAVILLAAVLVFALTGTTWPDALEQRLASGTDVLARLLFNEYVLALEIVSVLLLAAVIGGVFLAKREDEAPEPAAPPLPGAAAEPPLGTVPPRIDAGEGRGA